MKRKELKRLVKDGVDECVCEGNTDINELYPYLGEVTLKSSMLSNSLVSITLDIPGAYLSLRTRSYQRKVMVDIFTDFLLSMMK